MKNRTALFIYDKSIINYNYTINTFNIYNSEYPPIWDLRRAYYKILKTL